MNYKTIALKEKKIDSLSNNNSSEFSISQNLKSYIEYTKAFIQKFDFIKANAPENVVGVILEDMNSFHREIQNNKNLLDSKELEEYKILESLIKIVNTKVDKIIFSYKLKNAIIWAEAFMKNLEKIKQVVPEHILEIILQDIHRLCNELKNSKHLLDKEELEDIDFFELQVKKINKILYYDKEKKYQDINYKDAIEVQIPVNNNEIDFIKTQINAFIGEIISTIEKILLKIKEEYEMIDKKNQKQIQLNLI
jgi:hypothetical protein